MLSQDKISVTCMDGERSEWFNKNFTLVILTSDQKKTAFYTFLSFIHNAVDD